MIGYKYAHDYPEHYVKQQYLPDEIVGARFYEPTDIGHEKNIKERLEWHVRDLENKGIDVLDTDINDKFHLTTSWTYEYTMFELIHLYKTIDWKKYYLIWLGY